MGSLTQAQLIATATGLAGNTGIAASAQAWLKLLVNDLYSRADWPFLPGKDTNTPVTLAAGGYQHTLGASGDAFTGFSVTDVRRVRMAEAGSDIGSAWDVPVRSQPSMEEGLAPPGNTTKTGRPLYAVLRTDVAGKVKVEFYPKADKAYYVWYSIEGDFTDSVYSASATLAYPNDRTIVQGLLSYCLLHQSDERQPVAEQKFEQMVTKDLVKYGGKLKRNQKWNLSREKFKGRSGSNPYDWMGD